LQHNGIGDEGAKVCSPSNTINCDFVIQIIELVLKVTQLNLSENGIGDEGAKVIGESLSLNSTLAQLNLSGLL